MYETHPAEVKPEGSYVRGLIGALVGALIGATLWCLVMQLGVIAAIVGFAIGWLAEKGYTLMKGKVGVGKVVILVICVILGVLVGIFASEYIDCYQAIAEYYPNAHFSIGGEIREVTYSDIPELIVELLTVDSEYMGTIIKNVLMGLLFAFLGVFSILRNAGKQAKAAKQAEEQAGGNNL